PSVMTKLNVVALPDFFVYPHSDVNYEHTLNKYFAWRALKYMIWPHGYTVLRDSQYSPFFRVLARERRISTFSNPSIAALIDFKWGKARTQFINNYVSYFIFATSFWVITSLTLRDRFLLSTSHAFHLPIQIIFFYLVY